VELYDLCGRLLSSEEMEISQPKELEVRLDISSLSSGVYTLQATLGTAQTSANVVIVK